MRCQCSAALRVTAHPQHARERGPSRAATVQERSRSGTGQSAFLGYPIEEVHEGAERLEHFISERFEERIEAKLGYPKMDPHGHCIPAMDGKMPNENSVPLTQVVGEGTFVVGSISDRDAAIVKLLRTSGIVPGVQLRVRNLHVDEGYAVSIGRSGKVLHLSHAAADSIRIHPRH
jgi:DtxR family Mn-dependent transcriptional regulator